MNDNRAVVDDADHELEDFAVELTAAAYAVALRHGVGNTWLDLQLDLWRALTETVTKWRWEPPPRLHAAFVCDWAVGQCEAAHRDGGHGLGHGRDAHLPLSGE